MKTRKTKSAAKPVKLKRWDAAEHLRTPAEMRAYLAAILEEPGADEKLIAAALGDIARAHGMMKVARDSGVTREALYRALSPGGNPSFGTILKVTKALGLKLKWAA
jgi:probable addiction module antidote protein